MNRRTYLATATSTALAAGGIGTVSALHYPGPLEDVTFEVRGEAAPDSEAGANIQCDGTEVTVDGVFEARDSCHTAALDEATFAHGTLSVTVVEEELPDSEACLPAVTPRDYVATVGVPEEPDLVQVFHQGVNDLAIDHECGGGGSGTGGSGGSGSDGKGTGGLWSGSSGGGSDGSGTGGLWSGSGGDSGTGASGSSGGSDGSGSSGWGSGSWGTGGSDGGTGGGDGNGSSGSGGGDGSDGGSSGSWW